MQTNRRKVIRQRFKWTQKRLRTENRLLRQRIDYLEHESSALADRLIRGQVDLAQQADNCLNICHELNVLRDVNSDAHRRLEDAYDTIRELSCAEVAKKRSAKKSTAETGAQIDDMSMIEHIHSLQQELIEAHCRKSDMENSVRELKLRIHELESSNKRLKESSPDNGLASIQEELIRVKMREAESSLSLKEMRQRLAEIEQQWTKYIQTRNYIFQIGTPDSTIACSPSLPQLTTRSDSAVSINEPSFCGNVPSTAGDLAAEKNVSVNVIGDPGPSSPQHSPSSSLPVLTSASSTISSTAPVSQTSAPQRARERFAKFTATLIGAASGTSGNGSSVDETTSTFDGMTLRELEDQFMGLKIHETDTLAELKEMRQRVMELETQNHMCTNQLKRQDDELRRIKEEKETISESQREVNNLLKNEQRKLIESQSEMKEKNVMQRLKYTEALQSIADLKQHIAQLESKNAEKFAHEQLRGSSICDMDDDSLASGRSAGSVGGDTNSLASEEMSAFLADVTTKPFNKEDFLMSTTRIDNSEDEDDENATKLLIDNIVENGLTESNLAKHHNETSDSGLNLSD